MNSFRLASIALVAAASLAGCQAPGPGAAEGAPSFASLRLTFDT